jgi:hypothetical protein
MDGLPQWLDGLVIPLYRITDNPLLDYFIGTAMLAVVSVLIGEATALLLKRVNRRHIERLDRELSVKYELSMESKLSGDEDAYRSLNREANDAFGRVFFNMFTFSAALLWPVFFVLAWMQARFIDIEFPLPVFGGSVGYVFTFLLLYIMARLSVGELKRLMVSSKAAT